MNFTSNEYITSNFNNFIKNADDEQLCNYILQNVELNHIKKKYYSLIGHEFDSMLNDSLLSVLTHKGKIENELHLIRYFNKTLENKLKNRLAYFNRECRKIELISCFNSEEEINIPDLKATDNFKIVEILTSFQQIGSDDIMMDYIKLIINSDDKISDLEAARILKVNVKTIKAKKKKIKKKLNLDGRFY